MILLEYEAKQLLATHQIPIPGGSLYNNQSSAPDFPVVVKSQVPVGGRGKLGGIKIAKNQKEFSHYLEKVKNTPIKGFLPTNLLIEPALTINKELYLSVTIDRDLEQIQFTANLNGGVEIEYEDPESFLIIPAPNKNIDFNAIGEQLAEYYGLESQSFTLQDIAQNLYQAFVKNDALLIEINPLILTSDNKLVAGDAKIELDASAAYRHDWNYETPLPNANFVTLDSSGNIATIANGAGLAMATVDAIFAAGLKPANFLDIGGGADQDKVLEAFHKLMEFPSTKAIIINIFGGITRCDQIANAIAVASQKISNLPPLFIRLSGNNYNQAVTILQKHNIPLLPDLESCIELAKKEVNRD